MCPGTFPMNHIFMKMPRISSECPMKGISWPMKLQNLISWLYFWPWIFHERVTFYLMTHAFRMTRDSWALNFPWKTCHRVFHGPWIQGTIKTFRELNFPWTHLKYVMGHETIQWDFHWVLIFHQSKYRVFHESRITYNGTSIGYEYGWGCAP